MRISQKRWLLDTFRDGTTRFAPAASYDDTSLTARVDDEMGKTYNRPGHQLTISDGRLL